VPRPRRISDALSHLAETRAQANGDGRASATSSEAEMRAERT
jgi:hypothetical protein